MDENGASINEMKVGVLINAWLTLRAICSNTLAHKMKATVHWLNWDILHSKECKDISPRNSPVSIP